MKPKKNLKNHFVIFQVKTKSYQRFELQLSWQRFPPSKSKARFRTASPSAPTFPPSPHRSGISWARRWPTWSRRGSQGKSGWRPATRAGTRSGKSDRKWWRKLASRSACCPRGKSNKTMSCLNEFIRLCIWVEIQFNIKFLS